ncbi:MAG: response regulator [Bacteroidota bacterium]
MKPFHILLVEDNEGDIFLTTQVLRDYTVVTDISVKKDGDAAIQFLNEQTALGPSHLPDLILLDINLPKKNGLEVLAHIKNTEVLKQTPVIIFTTSSSDRDIRLSYQNHANSFVTKPIEIDHFLKIMSGLKGFWAEIVQLPKSK